MYNVVAGDTFSLVARKVYGTETEAGTLARANPGVTDPLIPGTVLVTPETALTPSNLQSNGASDGPDEVAVLIEGTRFRYWEQIELKFSLDALTAVTFSAPNEPDAFEFRETFRPFSYKKVTVTLGGNPLFTGVLVGVNPQVDDEKRTVGVSCYSKPGVLMDCGPPASAYPIEFAGRPLNEIATTLCAPFGVSVVFLDSPGAVFDSVAMRPTDKIFGFLVGLAKQRGLVITNDAFGSLVFKKAASTGQPVAILAEGFSPVDSVKATFQPQGYYDSITGLEPAVVGIDGSKYTGRNKHLSGVLRPHTFEVSDSMQGDAKTAVDAKLGRMFGDMASYAVGMLTWRDPQGALLEPDTFVKLTAPGAMVYSEYSFLIRTVTLTRSADESKSSLGLVLPGAFSGVIPEGLPWD